MIGSTVCFIWILATSCFLSVIALDYNDLVKMGINCPDKVSCASPNSGDINRSCRCDNLCDNFNDCCIDSEGKKPHSLKQNQGSSPISCMPYGNEPDQGAFVISKCAPHYKGPKEMRDRCLNQNNISDPVLATPVQDITTNYIYWNRYCAECNNVNITNTKMWQIRMSCESVPSDISNNYILLNIKYKSESWGVYIGQIFHNCDLWFEALNDSKPDRYCRPDIISDCPDRWRDKSVERDCMSYNAVVLSNDHTAYKNPHCAVCHGVDVSNLNCLKSIISKKNPISYAHIFDFNLNYGELVGVTYKTPRCMSNQLYDPYFDKCRPRYCLQC